MDSPSKHGTLSNNGYPRTHISQTPNTPFDRNAEEIHASGRPEDHWSCIAHLIAEDML